MASLTQSHYISASQFCSGWIGLAIGVVQRRSESIEKYSSCGGKGAKKPEQAGKILFNHFACQVFGKSISHIHGTLCLQYYIGTGSQADHLSGASLPPKKKKRKKKYIYWDLNCLILCEL